LLENVYFDHARPHELTEELESRLRTMGLFWSCYPQESAEEPGANSEQRGCYTPAGFQLSDEA
ncbi:TPA: hypothetical protein ACMELW_005321, partial [Klebsiella variicola subsp. variicola]